MNQTIMDYSWGYRYLKTKGAKVTKYTFKSGSSVGRVASQMVKSMINDNSNCNAYLISDPSSLTFSSSQPYLVNKYKLKYNAGGRSKGPFYEKSVIGLFRLILRTMMKYKSKHKYVYKKIYIMKPQDQFSELSTKQVYVEVKPSLLTGTITLKKLITLI